VVTLPPMRIRPADAADVDKMLDLLEPEEFVQPLTRAHLRRLFDYEWATTKINFGIVLEAGESVVGMAATVYSPARRIDGRDVVTLNSGTLFIRPRYRARRTGDVVTRFSEEVARAVVALGFPVFVFSARGPNDVVPKILADVGFEEICSEDLFYTAGSHLRTWLRAPGRVASISSRRGGALTAEQLRIVRDHEPYGCRFYVVRDAGGHALIVTKRRRYRAEMLWPSMPVDRLRRRYMPVSDVLHVSDPDRAVRSWGRVIARICREERTAGVTCCRSFFDTVVPAGRSIPQKILVCGLNFPVRFVDKLYSEFVLLP
jgi:hypothetical protein